MKAPAALLIFAVFALTLPLAGCDRPCQALEERLCETMKDKSACETFRDPERREAVTDETCARVLENLDER